MTVALNEIPIAARRYALAFFKETYQKESENPVLDDVQLLNTVIKSEVDFHSFLLNQYIDGKIKNDLIAKSFSGKVSAKTKVFLDYLAHKKRIDLLPGIVESYILYDQQVRGIKKLTIYLASREDVKLEAELVASLEKKMNCQFDKSVIIDAKLIGGFKYKIEGTVYDCSFQGKLNNLSNVLMS